MERTNDSATLLVVAGGVETLAQNDRNARKMFGMLHVSRLGADNNLTGSAACWRRGGGVGGGGGGGDTEECWKGDAGGLAGFVLVSSLITLCTNQPGVSYILAYHGWGGGGGGGDI